MSLRIVAAILSASGLTAQQRLTLLSLANHAHDNGRDAHPGLSLMASETSLSVRSIRRRLRDLENLGLIQRTDAPRHHSTTSYQLTIGSNSWESNLLPIRADRLSALTEDLTCQGGQLDTQTGQAVIQGGQLGHSIYSDARAESVRNLSKEPHQKEGMVGYAFGPEQTADEEPHIPALAVELADPDTQPDVTTCLSEPSESLAAPTPSEPATQPPAQPPAVREASEPLTQPAVSDSAVSETPGFVAYMQAHPKSTYRTEAWQEWHRQGLEEMTTIVLRATRRASDLPQWQQEQGRYAPNPAAFLRDGGWRELVPELKPCVHKWTDYGDLEMCGRCCAKRPSRSVEEAALYAEV